MQLIEASEEALAGDLMAASARELWLTAALADQAHDLMLISEAASLTMRWC